MTQDTPTLTTADDHASYLDRLQHGYHDLKEQLHHVIVGQDEAIDNVLCCLLAGGHCLMQGVPGLAKTLLVRSLSQALELDFSRIQFTPDLMPSDITGAEIIQEGAETARRELEFVKGPIFAHIVLADEINRTPPKTQAALLQAMQEREVTAPGGTFTLEPPFFVLATQNPIEQEGTYPLPEAALDRFMFMVYIDYPSSDEETLIVKRTTAAADTAIEPVLTRHDILRFQEIVRLAPISDTVIDYAVALARATRPDDASATNLARQYLQWGAGPRAGQYLTIGAKARALLKGRISPSYDDVKAIAKLVLRHRIRPSFAAEADGLNTETILTDLIKTVALPS